MFLNIMEEDVIDLLYAVLQKQEAVHYEKLIANMEDICSEVESFFDKYSSSQRFHYFRQYPAFFSIGDDGYVAKVEDVEAGDPGIDTLEGKAATVLCIQLENFDGSVHYEQLANSLRAFCCKVKNFFSTYSSSQKYWFFKNNSDFIITGSGFVSVSYESNSESAGETVPLADCLESEVGNFLYNHLQSSGRMHYRSLLKSLNAAPREIAAYAQRLTASQEYWFFKNRPDKFAITNSGFVTAVTQQYRSFFNRVVIDRLKKVLKQHNRVKARTLYHIAVATNKTFKEYLQHLTINEWCNLLKQRPDVFTFTDSVYVQLTSAGTKGVFPQKGVGDWRVRVQASGESSQNSSGSENRSCTVTLNNAVKKYIPSRISDGKDSDSTVTYVSDKSCYKSIQNSYSEDSERSCVSPSKVLQTDGECEGKTKEHVNSSSIKDIASSSNFHTESTSNVMQLSVDKSLSGALSKESLSSTGTELSSSGASVSGSVTKCTSSISTASAVHTLITKGTADVPDGKDAITGAGGSFSTFQASDENEDVSGKQRFVGDATEVQGSRRISVTNGNDAICQQLNEKPCLSSTCVTASRKCTCTAAYKLSEFHVTSVRTLVSILNHNPSLFVDDLVRRACEFDKYVNEFLCDLSASDVRQFLSIHPMYFVFDKDGKVSLKHSNLLPCNVLKSSDDVLPVIHANKILLLSLCVDALRKRSQLHVHELQCELGLAPGFVLSFLTANNLDEEFVAFLKDHPDYFSVEGSSVSLAEGAGIQVLSDLKNTLLSPIGCSELASKSVTCGNVSSEVSGSGIKAGHHEHPELHEALNSEVICEAGTGGKSEHPGVPITTGGGGVDLPATGRDASRKSSGSTDQIQESSGASSSLNTEQSGAQTTITCTKIPTSRSCQDLSKDEELSPILQDDDDELSASVFHLVTETLHAVRNEVQAAKQILRSFLNLSNSANPDTVGSRSGERDSKKSSFARELTGFYSEMELNAIDFFRKILRNLRRPVPASDLQVFLLAASEDIRAYLTIQYGTVHFRLFFENHPNVFNVDSSGLVSLKKSFVI